MSLSFSTFLSYGQVFFYDSVMIPHPPPFDVGCLPLFIVPFQGPRVLLIPLLAPLGTRARLCAYHPED